MARLDSRKNIRAYFLLIITLSLILTGCWDRRELEDEAFVQAIGVDKHKTGQLMVTFRIAIPSKAGLGQTAGGGGGEGSIAKQASLLTTVIAPSIPSAITLTSGYVNRELNLVHMKTVVFGEDFARQGVLPLTSLLTRYRQIRRNVFLAVTAGEAQKLLQNNAPDLEKSYAKWWEGVKLIGQSDGIHPGTLLHEFLSDTESMGKSGTMMYLALNKTAGEKDASNIKIPAAFKKGVLDMKAGEIPRIGGNPVEYFGTAVFAKDRFVDVLNGTETRVMLALQGRFRKGFLTVKDPLVPDKYIAIELKQGAYPIVKVSLKNGQVVIEETYSLEGDLVAIQSPENYASDINKQKLLEKYVRKALEQRSADTVKKLQKLKTDTVGFGDYVKRHFLTQKEWEKFNWPERFPEAKIIVHTKFEIRRTGLQGEQPEIQHEEAF